MQIVHTWWAIHDDVDPENLHGIQWIRNTHQCRECNQRQGSDRCTQLESYKVPDVMKNGLAFLDSRSNCKIVNFSKL